MLNIPSIDRNVEDIYIISNKSKKDDSSLVQVKSPAMKYEANTEGSTAGL